MQWIIKLDEGLARLSNFCGWVACVAMLLMAGNVFFDVVARYAFNEVSIGMQEMEWHLYSVVFLFGIPYALRTDGHVRVDVLYARWSNKAKAWVNLTGALIFVVPFAYLIGIYGYDFALDSYNMGEGSGDPGGLPQRWIIKSAIPVSALFIAIAGLNMATFALRVMSGEKQYESEHSGGTRMIGMIMFLAALFMLMLGFPVAFTFGGLALFFGVFSQGMDLFAFMPYRIMSVMQNTVLMAVPLFIFMGVVLQRTRLAEQLLTSMGRLFGGLPGGLAISTILVGALLAASTGVVGASVVAMGLISLPVMLAHNYDKRLATGTICAAGTLGQIVPPSIILIILGDVLGLPVGDLFRAAVGPGVVLIGLYIVYILIMTRFKPETAPPMPEDNSISRKKEVMNALLAIIPPLALIVIVLGSIFTGIATPTESSALGGVGAIVLAIIYRQFSFQMVWNASKDTVKVTAMVFAILVGATAFSMVFSYTGGDYLLEEWMLALPGEKWGFIILAMLVIMVLGFFIDFVEISFIIVPILAPVAEALGINMLWFAILIAMNLQTSFLTPPFGFSLFYLRGVAPPQVRTIDIYKGVLPFILLQVFVLALIVIFPEWFGMSSSY